MSTVEHITPPPHFEGSLSDLIRTWATAAPDQTALICADKPISAQELFAESCRVAQALLATGLSTGSRVAFIGWNCPEFFSLFFGACLAGCTLVPVNCRLAGAEIDAILTDAGATVVVADAEFADLASACRPVKEVLTLGDGGSFAAWVAQHPAIDPGLADDADAVPLQIYTSGTTGDPKGVLLSAKSLGFTVSAAPGQIGISCSSVSLVAMPLFHGGGILWSLLGMSVGCPSVLLRRFDPTEVWDAIGRHGVTHALLVPSMLDLLMAADHPTGSPSSLKTIVYGASPITEDLLIRARDHFRCKFVQVYGLSESAGAVCQLNDEDHTSAGGRRLRSAGRPYPWVSLRVVDPETQRDTPAGGVGEVWVRSAQVMSGYWQRPVATAEAITTDGWLRTGDAGFVDGDGYLYLTGRLSEFIIRGGENIYPTEVENVLASHPGVSEVAVVGVPDDRWGETVKAFAVLRRGHAATPADIIAFARSRLASFKCPTSVEFVDELPRNASGKVLRKQLRERHWAGRSRSI